MDSNTTIEIYGIKKALTELNKIDASLRRQVTKDYKRIVSSVIADAESAIPMSAPLSGMNRKWATKSGNIVIPPGGWNKAVARKFLTAKISTRKVKEFRGNLVNVGTFRIVWSGLANQTFDMAGRKAFNQMAGALTNKFRGASRALWPAFEKNKNNVEAEMLKLCEDVMKEVNRNLVTNQGS
jgi:hypothetical protein